MKTEIKQVTIYVTSDGYKFEDRQKAIEHENGIPFSKYYVMLDHLVEFEVKENHLKLLKKVHIDWCFHKDSSHDGHFYQNIKRPYGNSDWIGDIADILKVPRDDEQWFTKETETQLIKWHIDMKIVMQILTYNQGIKIGKYRKSSYGIDWEYCH
jgi:hypothetical protein